MRIALVNSEYEGSGGIGTYTRNLARALSDTGHEVHVLQKEMQKQEDGPCCYHVVKRSPLDNRFLRFLGYSFFWEINLHLEYAKNAGMILKGLFDQGRIDIAEIPEFYGEGFFLSPGSRYPYVCRLHTPWYWVRKWNCLPEKTADWWIDRMEKRTLQKAAAVSSPSAWLIQALPKSWKIRSGKQEVIPYPIQPGGSSPLPKEFELEIAFVGRLERRKGFDWFCKILPDILERFSFCGAVIAGARTTEAEPWILELERQLQARKLGSRCRFLGEISSPDARALIARSDIVTVPSRFDNFPNVVLEAMSAGRCIVASRSGGIGEILEDQKTGLLFDPGEQEEGLQEKLMRCIQDAGLRRNLGLQAGEKAKSTFAPDKIARQTILFYEEVLSHWKK